GADFGLSVHLGPDGQSRAHTIQWSRHQVQRAVQRIRQAILEGDGARASELGHELSTTLFEGMGDWTGEQTLRLMLHGPMQDLPIALLQPQGSSPRLICNTTLWNACKELGAAPDWRALSWHFLGAPNSSRYDELPAARKELLWLAHQKPGATLRTGAGFNRAALRMAMTSGDALHLATHLVMSEACTDPELKAHGLLLGSEQVLCASTIRDWSPSLPLAYLGACASGSGVRVDGEGQLGLARALQAGGTRNLIVTLWPVSDRGSAAFGKAFHAA
ncbi:MAG: CHAT domain-containing protein, partial [bacterium]|nr:CHAT domain-containing protein [bacterium]